MFIGLLEVLVTFVKDVRAVTCTSESNVIVLSCQEKYYYEMVKFRLRPQIGENIGLLSRAKRIHELGV